MVAARPGGKRHEQTPALHMIEVSRTQAAILEARGGIEPPMKVLQTFALPLGDRALNEE